MSQSIENQRKLRGRNQNLVLHASAQRYGQKKGDPQVSFSISK
jgi:hypothetical protein